MGKSLRTIGGVLFLVGVAALAGIFLTVMVNGAWPLFLKPIQSLFAGIADYVGDFAFVVEGLLFVGPGLAIAKLGDVIEQREQRAT